MRPVWIFLAVLLLLSPAVPKESAAQLVKQAEKQFHDGNYAEALKTYNQAIQTDPGCSQAYTGRGIMYTAAGQGGLEQGDQKTAAQAFTLAIADFDKSVKLNPREAVVFLNRGLCHYRLGHIQKALADTEQALKLKPLAQAYVQRGQIKARLGDDRSAAADFGKAYEINKDASILFNRGNCFMRLDQVEKARADYRTVIKLCKNPRMVEGARNNLEALEQAGNPNKPSRPK